MREKALRNPLGFFRNQQPGFKELPSLLNLLPHPTVILDSVAGTIVTCNTKALQYTAYTRAELEASEYTRLFPDFQFNASPTNADESVTYTISLRNGLSEQVVVESTPLDAERHWIILGFEPLTRYQKRLRNQQRQQDYLKVLLKMSQAMEITDPDEVNVAFLEAGLMLTGAGCIALYRVDPGEPQLVKVRQAGKDIPLPDTVLASDVGRNTVPNFWAQGKRIRTGLQRIARASGLNYLASVGIGEENALFGILIAADVDGLPEDNLLEMLEALGTFLGTIFQHDVLINQLRKINLELTGKLTIADTILENVQDGVLVLTLEMKIQRLNPAAELILGYALDEVAGTDIENVLIGTEKLKPALKLGLEGIQTPSLGKVTLHRRDGRSFPAEIQILPIEQNGSIGSLIIFLRDLSEHHQIQARTQQLEQRALLGEVTAIFAHEVRNPLNNISMALQIMDMNFPPGDPNRELVEKMKQDTDRLLHLMNSILTFSRTADRQMEPVNLVVFLERLLLRWQPRMTRVNVKSEIHIAPGTPMIRGNEQSLEQVFTNLFHNALRAMNDGGGTLSVRVNASGQKGVARMVHIDVSDTGIGIPPENLEVIFNPFFTTDPQGTGLGLAITQSIITAHRGSITVESFPGGGTVFHITLPALQGTGSLEGKLPI